MVQTPDDVLGELESKPKPKRKPKKLTDDDLFETRPNAEAIVQREQAPAPRKTNHTRKHENYGSEQGAAGSEGSSDYQWAMEDSTTDTAKALEAFMGKGDLRKESELDENHIRASSLLLEMAGRYKLPRIRNAVHHFLACRVSKDRGSRGEAVAAFTGLVENRRVSSQENIANSLRREM
jgi:hypothetical protein